MCDCYRSHGHHGEPLSTITENRIFHDPSINLTVAYFQYFGSALSPRGSIPFDDFINGSQPRCPPGQRQQAQSWSKPIHKFLSQYLVRLRPTHVFINAGLWSVGRGMNWSSLADAAGELKQTGSKVFWRSTPVHEGKRQPYSNEAEYLVSRGLKLYDAARLVHKPSFLADGRHLTPLANVELVQQMIGHILCSSGNVSSTQAHTRTQQSARATSLRVYTKDSSNKRHGNTARPQNHA